MKYNMNKESNEVNVSYDDVKNSLSKNERLTGQALQLALDLVDVSGDDELSNFMRNIGVKLKSGQQLGDYEYHILVDVLMLHARLAQ